MKCSKKLISWLFLFSLIISCKNSKNYEVEPNNTFSNANTIEINKEIYGFLDSENDIDNYILNVTEEQILKLELSGIKGVNHAINIYKNENSKPQLLKVIDDNRKSAGEIFSNLYVQTGQYIFTITHGSRDLKKGNTETPYKFLITSRPYMNEEKEPNDNPYSANQIADQAAIIGYFSPGQNILNNDQKYKMRETDCYKFNVIISENVPVLIDIQLTGVKGVDSVLTLFNSGMEEILSVDNAATGEGETIADFGIKDSGDYYIQVSSKNFLFNNDIPYELRLKYKTFERNSELEVNNSFDKANIITDNTMNGKISSLDDRDYFLFIPPLKNKNYKAKCIGADGMDIIMTIFDNNRNKLFEINNIKGGGAEIIPCFLISNSVYFLISASALSTAEPRYTLEIEKLDSNDIFETEPNNTKATANLVNRQVKGFITYKNDIDYYMVKYEERKKVKITVRGVKDGKIKVSTTDPQGFIIKTKEIQSDEEVSLTEIFDKKGYIIVEPIVPNFEYPYTITLEEL